MENILEHCGVKARIAFDPDIDMFRGEILGLSGSADFYAEDISSLKQELENSLDVYLEACKDEKIEPYKNYNGKISFRTEGELHYKLDVMASSLGMSINKLLGRIVESEIRNVT